MKINFNLKEIIKHKKKEIVIVLAYLLLFSALMFLINAINVEIEDGEFDEELAEIQYNSIKNSNLSEDVLIDELKQLTQEVEELKQKLPSDLEYRTVNTMLAEMIKDNGNLFNLGNCNVSELKTEEGYSAYEVKISSVNGSYYQVKNFINYIEKYKAKVIISQLDLNKNSSEVQGTMTLVFYGEKKNGEIV